MGSTLRQIAEDDGLKDLSGVAPRRPELLKGNGIASGYPMFSIFSELGSHPGVMGTTLLALRRDTGEVAHDLGGAVVARALWSSVALGLLWNTCSAAAPILGWQRWLDGPARDIFMALPPLVAEAK